jgi:hypothetical protein
MANINPVVSGKSVPAFGHLFTAIYQHMVFQGHKCVFWSSTLLLFMSFRHICYTVVEDNGLCKLRGV